MYTGGDSPSFYATPPETPIVRRSHDRSALAFDTEAARYVTARALNVYLRFDPLKEPQHDPLEFREHVIQPILATESLGNLRFSPCELVGSHVVFVVKSDSLTYETVGYLTVDPATMDFLGTGNVPMETLRPSGELAAIRAADSDLLFGMLVRDVN